MTALAVAVAVAVAEVEVEAVVLEVPYLRPSSARSWSESLNNPLSAASEEEDEEEEERSGWGNEPAIAEELPLSTS